MNPDLSNLTYIVNQYRRQDIMAAAQHERLVASLPQRAGRIDVLITHLGRGMVILGQWMQRQGRASIEEASLSYTPPAFDHR